MMTELRLKVLQYLMIASLMQLFFAPAFPDERRD
jgi:hypothetical protein